MEKNGIVKGMTITAAVFSAAWSLLAVLSASASQGYRVEKQQIAFDVNERKSNYVQKGWTIWLQEGENGFKNAVKKTGIFAGRRIIDKTVFLTGAVKLPKYGIKITGASDKKHPITVPKETYVHVVHNVEATAYDPSPESNSVKWAGITSLGWRTRYGIAAVDPRVISLRRLIYVDGYGFAWTGDVGGAIKGKRIDLCYNTTEEAFRWGRKKVKVYVLGTKPASHYKKQ